MERLPTYQTPHLLAMFVLILLFGQSLGVSCVGMIIAPEKPFTEQTIERPAPDQHTLPEPHITEQHPTDIQTNDKPPADKPILPEPEPQPETQLDTQPPQDIAPDKPACVPTTCAAWGANCGTIQDGCGKTLSCGKCTVPQTCGGGGQPKVCGAPACTPKTCQQLGANCGSLDDGCGKQISCGKCTAPQTCGGSGTPNTCGNPSCPAFTQRIEKKTLATTASIASSRAIMLDTLPDKTVRIAWADTAKKIHIMSIRANGQSMGADVLVDGEFVNGFVAHTDGYALLVRRAETMVFVRTDKTGKTTKEVVLVGNNNHTKVNDKWVDSWGHRGRLLWSDKDKKYAAYFGHNMLWSNGKHQGDILMYLDATGKKVSGGWGWGCSHSIDVRIAHNGARFGPVCASDCYPKKSISFNHRTLLREESGNCSGNVSATLGGLVPLSGNGFALSFASTYRNKKQEKQNEIGLLHITSAGKLGHVKWLTNAPTVAKHSPQMAAYGSNFLVGWLEGSATKLAVVDLQGASVIKAMTASVPLAASCPASRFSCADRGDFENTPDGDVIWATRTATKELTYVRVRYCQ